MVGPTGIAGTGMMGKAVDHFRKAPFKERMKDTGFLIKHSFKVIGKDRDILTPTINMAIFTLVITVMVFASFVMFFTGKLILLGVLFMFVSIFILFPYKFFFDVRQKACQSWIVYNTVSGKDISYQDSKNHTKAVKWTLRKVGLVEMLIAFATSQRSGKGGIVAVLINIFLAALKEVWDLLSHYMIPAVAIEQKPIMEIIPTMKSLKKNVPATLVGVFGIDFVGKVVNTILTPVYGVMLIVSVGLGYLLSSSMPSTTFTMAGISFTWVPIMVIMFIIVVAGIIVKKIVEATKTIYFTIFYTSIMRPKEIDASMKEELTHYLKFEETEKKV